MSLEKMRIFITHICLLLSFVISAQTVKVEMQTELGTIVAELYTDKAPITSKNFIKYIQNNQYDSAHFYRVVRMDNQPNNEVKIEVIQGGLGFSSKRPYPPIEHETTEQTGILHKDGTLSMARSRPGSASSEIFICINDQPELDFGGKRNPDGQGFAAFGQVIEGMEVVRKIQNMKSDGQRLLEIIKITSIKVL